MKNHTGKILVGALTTLVAALATLTFLGVLPWATRAELGEFKLTVDKRLERIDKRMDDLHGLFFPGRRVP